MTAAPRQPHPTPPGPSHEAAWADLLRFVSATLKRRLALPLDELEDLSQDVLVALLRNRKPAQSPDDLRGLAFTVAVRMASDWLRDRYRPLFRNRKPWLAEYADTISQPEPGRLVRDVEEAMSLMTDDVRRVFEAVHVRGMKLRAAAATLSLSLYEVRTHCAEAIRFLRTNWGIEECKKWRKNRTGSALARF